MDYRMRKEDCRVDMLVGTYELNKPIRCRKMVEGDFERVRNSGWAIML